MRLAIVAVLSASLGFLMAYGALKTAEQIAQNVLVKQEEIADTN